jgi:hypothetical protein
VKLPPPAEEHVLRPVAVRRERDSRFLVFAGIVLVALALGLKSELVAPSMLWPLGAGLLVVAGVALLPYLNVDRRLPPIEHFVPAALGALAVAGLAQLMVDWWKYALIALAFGVGFYAAAALDYFHLRDQAKPGHLVVQESVMALGVAGSFLVVLTLNLELPLRLAAIMLISFLASYRSFRVLGRPMPTRRALLFSLFVAQLVTFFAWAMTVYLYFREGFFAVMLLLLWYVNRGIIRHTVEETLTRHVVVEYGLFVLLIGYLFFVSAQAQR